MDVVEFLLEQRAAGCSATAQHVRMPTLLAFLLESLAGYQCQRQELADASKPCLPKGASEGGAFVILQSSGSCLQS